MLLTWLGKTILRREKAVAIQKLCLCLSCRSPLESLVLWCSQNANHPGHPGSVDQCRDHPPLWLGKFTPSGRPKNTAAFLTGAAKCHWMPKVSPMSLPPPAVIIHVHCSCNFNCCFTQDQSVWKDDCWYGNGVREVSENISSEVLMRCRHLPLSCTYTSIQLIYHIFWGLGQKNKHFHFNQK